MVAPRERRTVHYAGRVQGVGFRYTTQRVAQNFDVDGFVQNLPDGRVLVVAEGTSDELDGFLMRLNEDMNRYIQKFDVNDSAATDEFEGFGIRND